MDEQQSLVANANKMSPQPRMGPGQSFLESLNAKLAQQHIANAQTPQLKANRIRQIINSKAQVCIVYSLISQFQDILRENKKVTLIKFFKQ